MRKRIFHFIPDTQGLITVGRHKLGMWLKPNRKSGGPTRKICHVSSRPTFYKFIQSFKQSPQLSNFNWDFVARSDPYYITTASLLPEGVRLFRVWDEKQFTEDAFKLKFVHSIRYSIYKTPGSIFSWQFPCPSANLRHGEYSKRTSFYT